MNFQEKNQNANNLIDGESDYIKSSDSQGKKTIIQNKQQGYNSNKPASPLYNTFHKEEVDIDALQFEIENSKKKNNIQFKECKELQKNYTKLDSDNKVNIKLIGTLIEAQQNEEETQHQNKHRYSESKRKNISTDSRKYEESKKIKILKREINEYQRQLDQKNQELDSLRQNPKVINMIEIENNLISTENELKELTVALHSLDERLYETDTIIRKLNNKIEFYKKQSIQVSFCLRDKQKINEENEKKNANFQDLKNDLEIKLKNKHEQNEEMTQQIKEKIEKVVKLKEENKKLEGVKKDSNDFEKREQTNLKQIKLLKKDHDKLKTKLQELNKSINNNKTKIKKYEKERPILLEKAKDQPTSYREKESKIKELQEELEKITEQNKMMLKNYDNKCKVIEEDIDKVKNENEEFKSHINYLQQENNATYEEINNLVGIIAKSELKNKSNIIQIEEDPKNIQKNKEKEATLQKNEEMSKNEDVTNENNITKRIDHKNDNAKHKLKDYNNEKEDFHNNNFNHIINIDGAHDNNEEIQLKQKSIIL